jgi:hypothetical protein
MRRAPVGGYGLDVAAGRASQVSEGVWPPARAGLPHYEKHRRAPR